MSLTALAIALAFELQARPCVPAIAPDSLPADYGDSTTWVSGGSHFRGTILRDILVLVFKPGTSQPDRQAAVDLVHGVVVGGRHIAATGGLYLVRVPTDGMIEPLFQAIGMLRALPQVSIAMPDEIIFVTPRAASHTNFLTGPTAPSQSTAIAVHRTPTSVHLASTRVHSTATSFHSTSTAGQGTSSDVHPTSSVGHRASTNNHPTPTNNHHPPLRNNHPTSTDFPSPWPSRWLCDSSAGYRFCESP